MRRLNQDEAARLAKMRGKVGDILGRRHEGLVEFFEMIGLKAPYAPGDAESLSEFLRAACAFAAKNVPNDHEWRSDYEIGWPLSFLMGDILADRLGGEWIICDDPDSSHFARPMIGNLRAFPGRSVSPFDIVDQYLDEVEDLGPVVSVFANGSHYKTTRGGAIRTLLSRVDEVISSLRIGRRSEGIE